MPGVKWVRCTWRRKVGFEDEGDLEWGRARRERRDQGGGRQPLLPARQHRSALSEAERDALSVSLEGDCGLLHRRGRGQAKPARRLDLPAPTPVDPQDPRPRRLLERGRGPALRRGGRRGPTAPCCTWPFDRAAHYSFR